MCYKGYNLVADSTTENLQALMNRRPQGYLKIGSLLIVSWRSEIDAHNPEVAGSSPAPAIALHTPISVCDFTGLLKKKHLKKLDGNNTLFYHPHTRIQCAGDYPSDNHSKTPPYIEKFSVIVLFTPYVLLVFNAHRGSNS